MVRENKATDYFKQTIRTYLEQRAETDELFAERYADPKKNIDDCTTYILNQVQASGCHGFADEEIYAMALHYYDEPGHRGQAKSINCPRGSQSHHRTDRGGETAGTPRCHEARRAGSLCKTYPAQARRQEADRRDKQMNLLF